jgi:hypothetical protein
MALHQVLPDQLFAAVFLKRFFRFVIHIQDLAFRVANRDRLGKFFHPRYHANLQNRMHHYNTYAITIAAASLTLACKKQIPKTVMRPHLGQETIFHNN